MQNNYYRFVVIVLYVFLFLPIPSVSAGSQTVAFTPARDAYVRSGNADVNYGSQTSLAASNFSSTDTQQAYLLFDLEGAAGMTISGAVLELTVNLGRTVSKDVRLVPSTDWTESGIIWTDKPALGIVVGTLPAQSVVSGTTVSIALDAAAISQYAGKVLALGIDNRTDTISTFSVNSREAATGQPVLRITTSSGTDSGDANGDGRVDGQDYVVWIWNYGKQTSAGVSAGDFNTDGRVDGLDYIIWLRTYGTITPSATPTSATVSTPTRTPTPLRTPTPIRTSTPAPGNSPTPYPSGTVYRAFTPDSYWNTAMPADAPIDPHNDEYITDAKTRSDPAFNFIRLSGAPGHTDAWAYPIYWSKASDKLFTVSGSNGPTVNIRIPSGAIPMTGSDGGIIIYDISSDQVVEFYQAVYNSSADSWSCTTTKRYILSSNGLEWGATGNNNSLNTGHRGQPPPERVVRRDEVASGHIGHRLECFWHDTGIKYQNHYWPMTGDEGAKGGVVPEGIVIRLKPSVNLNDPKYALSFAEKIIARAIQEYGCMIGDNEGGQINSTKVERGMAAWSALDPNMNYTALNVFSWDDYEFITGGYDPVTRTIRN